MSWQHHSFQLRVGLTELFRLEASIEFDAWVLEGCLTRRSAKSVIKRRYLIGDCLGVVLELWAFVYCPYRMVVIVACVESGAFRSWHTSCGVVSLPLILGSLRYLRKIGRLYRENSVTLSVLGLDSPGFLKESLTLGSMLTLECLAHRSCRQLSVFRACWWILLSVEPVIK